MLPSGSMSGPHLPKDMVRQHPAHDPVGVADRHLAAHPLATRERRLGQADELVVERGIETVILLVAAVHPQAVLTGSGAGASSAARSRSFAFQCDARGDTRSASTRPIISLTVRKPSSAMMRRSSLATMKR